MSAIKVGNKVRVVDNGQTYTTYAEWAVRNNVSGYLDHCVPAYGTEGEVVAVASHSERCKETILAAVTISGKTYLVGVIGLEVISQPNGVDGDGNPIEFTVADLKPFQRVVMKNGETGVVAYEQYGNLCICFTGREYKTYNEAYFAHDCKHHVPFVITEVYAPPHVNRAMDYKERGSLVFKAKDFEAERGAKLAAAEKAIAEAEVALAAAKAAKAAI